MKIKAFLLTLVVITTVFVSTSCKKDREYIEAEVLAAAEELIKKSENLNEIYYGKGISYEKNESYANGSYYPASVLHLSSLGISTVSDLQKLTRECFTQDFSDTIIKTKLSSVSDGNGIQIYARYYQKYKVDDNTPECIMVYKDADILLTDTVVYDYSSLKVEGSSLETVYVTVNITVTNAEGESQNQEKRIALIEEADGWRIDSPTYARYLEDKYLNEFQK